RENTILRANLDPRRTYVIPNAIITDQFKPDPQPFNPERSDSFDILLRHCLKLISPILSTSAPKVCALHPNVHFIIGGSGPKMIDLLQMREKYLLQDRIELIGEIPHSQVRDVLVRGTVYLNTSLTEAFGIALLEAACAGLYVVSTRVGGVPEVLPEDMVSFAMPNEDDIVHALNKAIAIVSANGHDPIKAHQRIKSMYDWESVTERTEKVYDEIMEREPIDLWTRMHRSVPIEKYIPGPELYGLGLSQG
ncbi:9488_t:CDS:2, partial [Acaulospora colombiana]